MTAHLSVPGGIPPEWRAVRRVLAVRLDNLGDVLITTPALHAIKQSLPHVHLTVLASPVGAQAALHNRDVDDVIVYSAPWMDPWRELPQDSRREQAMVETLRARQFDAAVIFTSFRQSALPAAYLCYLADIRLRLAASIDGPGSLLTTRHAHPERTMHEVERGLDLVGAVGLTTAETDLVLTIPSYARREAAALRRRITANRRSPLVVLHPGCSMPARTYPWKMYARVADGLSEHLDATVVLTGSTAERESTAAIRGVMRRPVVDLAGTLPFPVFGALIEAADLVITNNTGPMHMAAAVKTPVVVLFALTNPPEQWGPWHVPHHVLYHDVPCRLCYCRVCPYAHECLTLVTPDAVVDAAADLLAPGQPPVAGDGDGIRSSGISVGTPR